jgi:putative hydrolase of the HAD superfamily
MAAVCNVIFDLGGVLIDSALRSLLLEEIFRHPDWRAFNRGTFGEPELIERVARRTGRPLDELELVLDTVRESLVAKPASVALLNSLARRSVPLYCLSDMPVSVYGYVRFRLQFWDAFQGIVISGDVKMMKPEPEVFEHLLSRYQLAAAETVLVDDHPPNIDGARAVGLHGILFRDADQCARELEALLAGGGQAMRP